MYKISFFVYILLLLIQILTTQSICNEVWIAILMFLLIGVRAN